MVYSIEATRRIVDEAYQKGWFVYRVQPRGRIDYNVDSVQKPCKQMKKNQRFILVKRTNRHGVPSIQIGEDRIVISAIIPHERGIALAVPGRDPEWLSYNGLLGRINSLEPVQFNSPRHNGSQNGDNGYRNGH